MIKTIVVDDESYMIDDIKKKLNDFFPYEVKVVAEAFNVAEGCDLVDKLQPDLLLLDVHLKDGNGFDLIAKSTFKNYSVIFITGYDTNAIKAIKVGALDFILKPIDDDEFKTAMTKAIELKDEKKHLETSISVSKDYYHGLQPQKIILKTADSIYAIDQNDILYCQSDGNYTTVYLSKENKILISGHLKKIEALLPEEHFIRCHQSFMVNKTHVIKYNRQGHLLLINKVKIPVAARRREMTLRRLFGH